MTPLGNHSGASTHGNHSGASPRKPLGASPHGNNSVPAPTETTRVPPLFTLDHKTVYGEMLSVFSDLHRQQARLHELESEMADGCYDEEMLATYGELQSAFEHAGGYDYDLRIQQTLQGLGWGKQTWDMPTQHLSGGQKTRLFLARLLLEKPSLLMLMSQPTTWMLKLSSGWSG